MSCMSKSLKDHTGHFPLCLQSQEKTSSPFLLLYSKRPWNWQELRCLLFSVRLFPSPLFYFHTWPFFVSWILSFFSPVSLCFMRLSLSLQCSPLLKARRPIQKKGSAWRCVVSAPLLFQLIIFWSIYFKLARCLDLYTAGKHFKNLLFLFFLQTPKRVEVHSIHTYVALYKFLPQEKNDLELQLVFYIYFIFLCVCGWEQPGEKR